MDEYENKLLDIQTEINNFSEKYKIPEFVFDFLVID